jgi:hypothetical protein
VLRILCAIHTRETIAVVRAVADRKVFDLRSGRWHSRPGGMAFFADKVPRPRWARAGEWRSRPIRLADLPDDWDLEARCRRCDGGDGHVRHVVGVGALRRALRSADDILRVTPTRRKIVPTTQPDVLTSDVLDN